MIKTSAPKSYGREARLLLNMIRSNYIGGHGFLVREIDAKTGRILSHKTNISDLGDYLPFVLWLSRKHNDSLLEAWSMREIRNIRDVIQSDKGYFEFPESRILIDAGEWGDTFLGLVLAYLITKDDDIKLIIDKFVDFLTQYIDRNGSLARGFIKIANYKFKILFANPGYSGNFAEELLVLYSFDRGEQYLKLSEQILRFWLHNPFFIKTGFFPNRAFTGRGNFSLSQSAEMSKLNTNLLSALLEYYQLTKQEEIKGVINKWFFSLNSKLIGREGEFFAVWDERRKLAFSPEKPFAYQIPIINLFIDGSIMLNDPRLLETARHSIDYWLARKTKMGLFSESPAEESAGSARALLDSQTDFSVLLLKLFCLTKNEHYLNQARLCIDSVLEYYSTPFGLVWSIDAGSGRVISTRQNTKFLTLFTKALILLEEVLEGKDITKDRLLYILSRDR